MALLTFADGLVKIDGKPLPGILMDLSIDCEVRFDEQELDGASGQKRTPQGWEDANVNLTIVLTTEQDGSDCYEKLEELNKIFKGHDDNANPKVLTVVNRHILARGIQELIFCGLSSNENEDDDTIEVSLDFVEHKPPVIKTETKVAKSSYEKNKKPPTINPAAEILGSGSESKKNATTENEKNMLPDYSVELD